MNDSAIFGMLGLLIGGAGVWAVMRARREDLLATVRASRDYWKRLAQDDEGVIEARLDRKDEVIFKLAEDRFELRLAHDRLSDAHNTQSARIERALDQVTEGANATVVRMARILKGDL